MLHGAFLTGAHLTGANLGGADLRGADLRATQFDRAQLNNSDFANALVGLSVFGASDLSTVKGLETVRHKGPTSIDIDTIYLSKGNIPEAFLRGAGVPEDFIVYMKSLARDPIEFYSCFISYPSQDDEFARRLHAKVT